MISSSYKADNIVPVRYKLVSEQLRPLTLYVAHAYAAGKGLAKQSHYRTRLETY